MTRHHILIAIVLACALFPRGTAGAQNEARASLEGRVIDTADAYVKDARIQLVGVAETITDANGVYRLRDLAPGAYLLKVQHLGYTPVLRWLSLAVGVTERLDVELLPVAVQLERIDVTASAAPTAITDPSAFEYRRRNAVGGTFITEEEIVRRNAIQTEQLFREIPGISVVDGVLSSGRGKRGSAMDPPPPGVKRSKNTQCSAPAVFLNGAHVGDGFDVNSLAPGSLRGIEVYRGPATVPPMYRSYGTVCGAVLLWTK